MTLPQALAGAGIAGGRPGRGRAAHPQLGQVLRAQGRRRRLHELPAELTRTVTSSAQTRAAWPALAGASLSRWTLGSTLSTLAAEITVSNSTA